MAGVEVSTDGGATWHPATLTTPAEQSVTWSYTWVAHGTRDDDQVARRRRQRQPRDALGRASRSTSPARARSGATASRRPTPDSGDPSSVEVGREVHHRNVRHDHRHPLLQVGGQHRHPHRQPVDARAGRCWRRPRSPTRRRRAGSRSTSRHPSTISPNTTYVASYFAPNGHYADRPLLLLHPAPDGRQHARTARRCTRSGQRRTRERRVHLGQRRLLLQPDEHLPDQQPTTAPTTGSTRVHARRRARARSPNVDRHRRQRLGDLVSWTAPTSGGAVDRPTRSRPTSAPTAQPTTTVTGTPPATSATVTGLTNGDQLHVHGAGLQPQRRRRRLGTRRTRSRRRR